MGSDFAGWFSQNIDALLISMANGVIMFIINPLIKLIGTTFQSAVSLLPTFQLGSLDMATIVGSDFLAQMNWFVPFDVVNNAFVAIATAISCHYLVFPVLRWFKLVK